MSEQGALVHRLWSAVLRAANTWPDGGMTEAQKTAEIERMVCRSRVDKAERAGTAPPWARDLADRLDRIEKRLDRWEQFGKPTTKEWP